MLGATALDAAWTCPLIILAALVISWAAESAQYRISQGLALAILALVQTLPEYSVEAVLSWHGGKDPAQIHFMTANFTGALRLLMGLGWPLIFITAASFHRVRHRRWLSHIDLAPHHAAEVISLVPPCLYLGVVVLKGTLAWYDGVVLTGLYLGYLWLMSLQPPERAESPAQLEPISRFILTRRKIVGNGIMVGLFFFGGLILLLFVERFVDSVKALAVVAGVTPYFMIQWLAPFLSEFPEKLSAFYWARKISSANLGLMNMTSSAINEATLLVAVMPAVFCLSAGHVTSIPLDLHQRGEILLTLTTGLLAALLLADHRLSWWEALALFVLWLAGMIGPLLLGEARTDQSEWLHAVLSGVQALWIFIEVLLVCMGVRRWTVVPAMRDLFRHWLAGANSRA